MYLRHRIFSYIKNFHQCHAYISEIFYQIAQVLLFYIHNKQMKTEIQKAIDLSENEKKNKQEEITKSTLVKHVCKLATTNYTNKSA